MPRIELDFLGDVHKNIPTDEQLLLQLIYGLCEIDPREENSPFFVSSVGIPVPFLRRLAKLLVEKLNLPIPAERVDKFIEFRRHNHCWIVSDAAREETARLMDLTRDGEHDNMPP